MYIHVHVYDIDTWLAALSAKEANSIETLLKPLFKWLHVVLEPVAHAETCVLSPDIEL